MSCNHSASSAQCNCQKSTKLENCQPKYRSTSLLEEKLRISSCCKGISAQLYKVAPIHAHSLPDPGRHFQLVRRATRRPYALAASVDVDRHQCPLCQIAPCKLPVRTQLRPARPTRGRDQPLPRSVLLHIHGSRCHPLGHMPTSRQGSRNGSGQHGPYEDAGKHARRHAP